VETSTGLPMPGTIAGGGASPSPQATAAQEQLASQYTTYRAGILQEATGARNRALNGLYAVTTRLLPASFDYGQLTNDADGVRALWAIPTGYRMEVTKQLQAADGTVREMLQELIAGRRVSGNNFRLPKDLVEDGRKARAVLPQLEGRAKIAPPESLLNRLAGGDPEALDGLGAAAGALKAVPYIGASVGGVLQVIQDREAHESWRHSLVDGAASNVAALGASALVTGVAAGAITSGGFVLAGVAAVGAGALAVGVGDVVHNVVQENWGLDWDKYGFLDGTGHGVVDSLDKTRHDLAHYGDDILGFL